MKRDKVAAQLAYDRARRYKLAVDKFTTLMNSAITSVEEKIAFLMQDYDAIDTRVDEFLETAQQQFQVQCQLSGLVKTPGSDNGDTLRVYFLESMADASP